MAGIRVIKGAGIPTYRPPRTEFTRALVAMEVGDAIMVREGREGAPSKDAASMAAFNWGAKLGRVYRVDRVAEKEFGIWRME